jgi:serine/threonine protein kinase
VFENKYSSKVDVYSFAIVVWELFSESEPFEDCDNYMSVLSKISKDERPTISNKSKEIPTEIKILISKCWDKNPENRPTFSDIVKELKKIESKF